MTLTLSSKQIKSFKEADHRQNIWQGAVRSGKSFISLIKYIDFIKNGPPGDHILLGKTRESLKRNIIGELSNLLGTDLKYYVGKGEIHLWGRTIHVIGANDERAEHKIRGCTCSGAYVDEITIIPQSVYKMLLSRLSSAGARLYGTTNPDGPFHWFKTDYLDRADDLDLITWHFLMDDNPSLTEIFKNNLKKEYQGLWYQRFIEGKWVLAEGTVYDFFDLELHTINNPPGPAAYYIVGVDYGTTNPCVFSLIGYNPKYHPNIWLEKEYYWSSKEKNRQKTDLEYAEDLKAFIRGYNVKQIYIDPSAASFKLECFRQGIDNVTDAQNEVLDGIRFQSQLIVGGTYKVLKNCEKAIKEYQSYVWSERSARRGIDEPQKDNDHSLDSQRYALYSHFYEMLGPESTKEDLERRWLEATGQKTSDMFSHGWNKM